MADSEPRTSKRSRFDQTEPEVKRSSRFDRRSRSPASRHSEPRRSRSPLPRDSQSTPGAGEGKKASLDPAAAAGESLCLWNLNSATYKSNSGSSCQNQRLHPSEEGDSACRCTTNPYRMIDLPRRPYTTVSMLYNALTRNRLQVLPPNRHLQEFLAQAQAISTATCISQTVTISKISK